MPFDSEPRMARGDKGGLGKGWEREEREFSRTGKLDVDSKQTNELVVADKEGESFTKVVPVSEGESNSSCGVDAD